MKNFKIAFFFSIIFISNYGFSAHVGGGRITYDYIGDSTGVAGEYFIRLEIVRDQFGIQFGNLGRTINVKSSCTVDDSFIAQKINPPSHLDAGDGGFIIPGLDLCHATNALVKKYSLFIYEGTYILPSQCSDWEFSFTSGTRSIGIANFNLSNQSMYCYSQLNNTFAENDLITTSYVENSKVFCVGSQARISPFFKEADGDSIRFKLSTPFDDQNQPIIYASGYSAGSPLSSSTGTILNPTNGLLRFTPTQNELVVVGITIEEWRKNNLGVYYKIGETVRDFQINLTNSCDTNNFNWNPFFDSISSPTILECGDSLIPIALTKSTFCGSLSANGSDFKLLKSNGDSLEIKSIRGNCTDKYSDSIQLVLNDTLSQNDTLYLISRVGQDQNSLFNSCGFESRVGDTLMFRVQNCGPLNNFALNGSLEQAEWEIYPNPSSGTIKLNFNRMLGVKQISIFNVQGQLVFQKTSSSLEMEVDLSSLKTGIYFIQNESDSHRYSKKLLVE